MAKEKNVSKKLANDRSERRTKRDINYWLCRYKNEIQNLSRIQTDRIESYRPTIQSGIQIAIRHSNLDRLTKIYEILECYEYELLIKFLDSLLKFAPKNKILYRAKKLTSIRMNSWLLQLFRQEEAIYVNQKAQSVTGNTSYEFLNAENTINNSDLSCVQNSLSYLNPENYIIRKEIAQLLHVLPKKIGESGKKWAHTYKKIIEMQLGGIDVVGEHRSILGLESEKHVRELKCQAFKLAIQIVAEQIPELKASQAIFKKQKGKKWTIVKSTLNERLNYHRVERSDDMLPKTIRVWHVHNGGKYNI